MKKNTSWLPILGLLTAMVLWASSFVALKIAFLKYDPMVIIFGRMAVAAICFLFLLGRFKTVSYQRGDWKPLLFMVICEPCLYFILEAEAVVNTTASQAGMITALMPLLVAVAARFFLKEYISRRTTVGFLIAITGAVWLSVGATSSVHAPNPAWGNFLEFLAMVCGAGYTILLKKLSHRYSPLLLTAVQAYAGTVFYLALLFMPWVDLPVRIEWTPLLAIVYLGIFVTLGAYGLYNYGVSRIPASQASAFINLIPVFAVLMGWLILGETFSFTQYMACVLVFLGVFVSQDRRRPGTSPPSPAKA